MRRTGEAPLILPFKRPERRQNGRSKRKGATRRYGRPCAIAPWTLGGAPLLCGRPVARARLEKDLAMARRVRYHSFQEAPAHTAACGPGRRRCRFCVTGMWTGLSRRRVPVEVAPRDRPRSAGPDASDAGDGMNERRGMRDIFYRRNGGRVIREDLNHEARWQDAVIFLFDVNRESR